MVQGVTGNQGTESQNQSQAANSGSDVSKDEFLKLLTFQLRNQNPLKPYDNQEFSAQLAQFSQLEQITEMKSLLEQQVQTNLILTQTISNSALPGLIGKNAKAIQSSVSIDGENPVKLGYSLPANASAAKMVISDQAGNAVRTMDLSGFDLLNGDHKVEWDGKDNDGTLMPEGKYNFKVEVTDTKGSSFTADTFIFGRIEAVRFKTEGTKLVINGVEMPLENIMDISTEA